MQNDSRIVINTFVGYWKFYKKNEGILNDNYKYLIQRIIEWII